MTYCQNPVFCKFPKHYIFKRWTCTFTVVFNFNNFYYMKCSQHRLKKTQRIQQDRPFSFVSKIHHNHTLEISPANHDSSVNSSLLIGRYLEERLDEQWLVCFQSTLIQAITVAVQYTKIMYRPEVCTVPTYVPSRRMYRPWVCTVVPTYVPSRLMYHPDLCTVPTNVLFRRM